MNFDKESKSDSFLSGVGEGGGGGSKSDFFCWVGAGEGGALKPKQYARLCQMS